MKCRKFGVTGAGWADAIDAVEWITGVDETGTRHWVKPDLVPRVTYENALAAHKRSLAEITKLLQDGRELVADNKKLRELADKQAAVPPQPDDGFYAVCYLHDWDPPREGNRVSGNTNSLGGPVYPEIHAIYQTYEDASAVVAKMGHGAKYYIVRCRWGTDVPKRIVGRDMSLAWV